MLVHYGTYTQGLAVSLGSCELYGNRCIENHTLLQGVRIKFCHYPVCFSSDLGGIGDHSNLFRGCEFHKKWHSVSHILDRGIKGLLSCFLHWLFDLGEAGCKRSAHRGRVVRSPWTAESKGRQNEDFKWQIVILFEQVLNYWDKKKFNKWFWFLSS